MKKWRIVCGARRAKTEACLECKYTVSGGKQMGSIEDSTKVDCTTNGNNTIRCTIIFSGCNRVSLASA